MMMTVCQENRIILRVLTGLGIGLACIVPAKAELSPQRSLNDSRVRSVVYSANDVVSIAGTLGTSTMIVFGDNEKIETIAVGDSVSWKIEPNKRGNVIFLKPVEAKSTTNMNVVSDRRVYTFVLHTSAGLQSNLVYVVKFRYPDEDRDARMVAEARRLVSMPNHDGFQVQNANYEYYYQGDDQTKPTRVFDDGIKTWFKFSGDMPSVFIVDAAKRESLANFRREGDYIIVDKVSAQWMIRRGSFATCVINKGFGRTGTAAVATNAGALRSGASTPSGPSKGD
ncbi:P-type conjugative transfer protein VirB9 [Labrys portucalensis]|uniref:P-type conjugative transfer protein VirB9 n=1 Tax=Labrys neptuniae TaxID=376174 RepID=A0ABV6ZQW5_9HYPH